MLVHFIIYITNIAFHLLYQKFSNLFSQLIVLNDFFEVYAIYFSQVTSSAYSSSSPTAIPRAMVEITIAHQLFAYKYKINGIAFHC
jgi:hypothetical protein